MQGKIESFLEYSTWSRLIKLGDWILDEKKNLIIGAGLLTYLLSRNTYGEKPFTIQAELEFSNFSQHLAHSTDNMNAGIGLGWNSDKPNPLYYNRQFQT